MKKGQKVILEVHGAGVVSTEKHTVLSIEDGVVKLKNLEEKQFDATTGKQVNIDPTLPTFGFRFNIQMK